MSVYGVLTNQLSQLLKHISLYFLNPFLTLVASPYPWVTFMISPSFLSFSIYSRLVRIFVRIKNCKLVKLHYKMILVIYVKKLNYDQFKFHKQTKNWIERHYTNKYTYHLRIWVALLVGVKLEFGIAFQPS